MSYKMILIAFAVLMSFGAVQAQSKLEIGQWKSQLSHNLVFDVSQSEEKIIFATEQSIFSLDKDDMSIEYLSKVEGLTETGVSKIEFDKRNDALIIAYKNSVIDIVFGSEVFPVFDIYNNTNFVDRTINDIFIQNEEWMYLATGFGIVQYNLLTREFGFTLDAGQSVNKIGGNEDHLCMLTESGIFLLDYQNNQFPNALSSWVFMESGLPSNYEAQDVLVFDGKLLLATRDAVYASTDFQSFELIYQLEDDSFETLFLNPGTDSWILGLKDNSSSSAILVFDEMDIPIDEIQTCTNRLLDVEIDEKGRFFFADEWLNIRYIDESGQCHKEQYAGPFANEATDISIKDNIAYVASGGISDNFGDLYGRDGIYILSENDWTNINQDNNVFYRDEDVIQFYQIEAHPSEEKIYIGSFWAGLVEHDLETGEQRLFNSDNTQNILGSAVGDEQRTRVSGLSFDNDDNLWIASYNAARPLTVYTNEQTWHSFSLPGDNTLTDLVVDDLGNVWGVISGSTGSVVVYNPGENIKDPTDDIPARSFNVSNSQLPSNLVNSIAKDLDGAIWVGTAQGVVVFECGGAVFESVCQGNKPTVVQDNLGAYLLETEDVLSIAVDGANRKWFGTRNGIFVQSPNGEDQIAKFDVDNSPLFDNTVKAMAFNDDTGEMVISTDKGIQSYRTETTRAKFRRTENIYAFPNPVRPEYLGPIAIKGLARDSEVKITDMDGHLVFETDALGGQAIWDGKDTKGRDVAAGVYLVFSSSTDAFRDPETSVTKILVVR